MQALEGHGLTTSLSLQHTMIFTGWHILSTWNVHTLTGRYDHSPLLGLSTVIALYPLKFDITTPSEHHYESMSLSPYLMASRTNA